MVLLLFIIDEIIIIIMTQINEWLSMFNGSWLMGHGSKLMARGSRLVTSGSHARGKKEWRVDPRAWGTPRKFVLGHELQAPRDEP